MSEKTTTTTAEPTPPRVADPDAPRRVPIAARITDMVPPHTFRQPGMSPRWRWTTPQGYWCVEVSNWFGKRAEIMFSGEHDGSNINATFPLTESGAAALRAMLLAYGAIVEAKS